MNEDPDVSALWADVMRHVDQAREAWRTHEVAVGRLLKEVRNRDRGHARAVADVMTKLGRVDNALFDVRSTASDARTSGAEASGGGGARQRPTRPTKTRAASARGRRRS
jgi:hypothetical protein